MSVVFHALQPVSLKNRTSLKLFISQLFDREGKSLQALDIIFCSDEYLLDINNKHLKHNYYTDIITFDLSDPTLSEIVGELYISVDRVKENSLSLHTKFSIELLRVIFHGALHLCGYKDKKQKDIKTMRQKEDEYLELFNRL